VNSALVHVSADMDFYTKMPLAVFSGFVDVRIARFIFLLELGRK
jgi:hypothetical protein